MSADLEKQVNKSHKNLKQYLLFTLSIIHMTISSGQVSDSGFSILPIIHYNFVEPTPYTIRKILVYEVNGKPIQKAQAVFYSGLSIGQKITIPGAEIPKALSNLWDQSMYSDIQVYFQPNEDGTIVVIFRVEEQLRIDGHRFVNLSNAQSKKLDDETALKGSKGTYITPNIINRSKEKIVAYYQDKGYYNVKVSVLRKQATQRDKKDSLVAKVGFEVFDYIIDRGSKVKVQDIVFDGNAYFSDKQLRESIKKIIRRYHKWNILISSKYIESKFEKEKSNIINNYLSKGYRDARIIWDSIELISANRIVLHIQLFEGNLYRYRSINWKGNIKFSNGTLDTILGIRRGDVFNQTDLDEHLTANKNGYDVQSLFMNDGYLFFRMIPVEVGIFHDSIDLEIRMEEGPQTKVGVVEWKGNTKTSDRVIQREIRTRPGDVFSKSDIQRTMRDLSTLGLFDPEKMNVNPKPNAEDGTVDIEYQVTEKPSDQIELSGGWGGGGNMGNFNQGINNTPSLIGTAGISLNNFSRRKLLHRDLWNQFPSGDGQKLSLRAQSNGANFQSYNFSYGEPWFGGKKANNLSLSLNHSVNSFDFRQKSDPLHQVLTSSIVQLNCNSRLNWPDDFFSLSYGVAFNKYQMKNMDGGFYGFPKGFKGISYNPTLNLSLTRSSLSDIIFPMGGSQFIISLNATPPMSLVRNQDIDKLTIAEKYKWAEYHKWKFDAEWYTPIYKKLILMTKVRMGFLGSYNPKLGLTFFERFQVGGAGMFGYTIAATDVISQRGYDNYTISATAMGSETGAPIFNKFTIELRQAITTGQTATVYALAFLEAGEAWSSIVKYNPFQLKRAAGVGIRLFMPMFGLIGLDWAYGFDYALVPRSGKPTQIHFTIGQQF